VSALERSLASLLARLTERRARFALVGGLAVSVRTEPRFTRDADVCVAVGTDSEAEELVASLRAAGYRVISIVEQEATRRMATVRLVAERGRDDGVVLDLLFASSGVEQEVVETADELEVFEGVDAPVASVTSLIALKVLARDDATRPQDRVDLVALMRVASASDVLAAYDLCRLIAERGYQRGRDLAAELDALRAELED
jgi:predicted nucleotidyltransferase